MISRRTLLATLCAAPAAGQRQFTGRMGLQTYSLRYNAAKDLPATLALIRKLGFEEVEVSDLHGRSPAAYRRLLDDAGLKATALTAEYARLDTEVDAVADEAHQLGASYVVCSTIPSQGYLTGEECRSGAEFLSSRGESLAAADLRCCYHTHGTEFHRSPDGTVFDTLIKRTDPQFVNFEMDIFWIVYAGQHPAEWLHRYPGRFPLLHVKDIRKGTPLGGLPRDVREEDSVPLGDGIVDIPSALIAAQETGVRHYYIEDEAVDAARQIPLSLRYLETISG
jgi:sugar phosphate isomerase/epimerase